MGMGELLNNAYHGHRYRSLSKEDTQDIANCFNDHIKVIEELRGKLRAAQDKGSVQNKLKKGKHDKT